MMRAARRPRTAPHCGHRPQSTAAAWARRAAAAPWTRWPGSTAVSDPRCAPAEPLQSSLLHPCIPLLSPFSLSYTPLHSPCSLPAAPLHPPCILPAPSLLASASSLLPPCHTPTPSLPLQPCPPWERVGDPWHRGDRSSQWLLPSVILWVLPKCPQMEY